MRDFEIVPDDRRRAAKTGPRSSHPLWSALREGRTVFVPGMSERQATGYRTALKRQGFRLAVRVEHDPDGVLMWAEPIEAAK